MRKARARAPGSERPNSRGVIFPQGPVVTHQPNRLGTGGGFRQKVGVVPHPAEKTGKIPPPGGGAGGGGGGGARLRGGGPGPVPPGGGASSQNLRVSSTFCSTTAGSGASYSHVDPRLTRRTRESSKRLRTSARRSFEIEGSTPWRWVVRSSTPSKPVASQFLMIVSISQSLASS